MYIKLNYLLIAIVLLILSCDSKEDSTKNLQQEDNQQTNVGKDERRTIEPIEVEIAQVLYQNIDGNPWEHFDQYEELYFNLDHYLMIIDSLYGNENSPEEIKEKLDSNIKSFIQFQRKELMTMYQTYHSIESPELGFLYDIQDSVAIVLITKLLSDSLASENEKKRVLKNYP